MSVAIPRPDSVHARAGAPAVPPATLDLRGLATAPATGGHVLEDPTGRRARLVTRAARLVGAAFLVWLVLLVVGGIGLLPAGGVPFGKLILPEHKAPPHAAPQAPPPASPLSVTSRATPAATHAAVTGTRSPSARDDVIITKHSPAVAPTAPAAGQAAPEPVGATTPEPASQPEGQTGSSGTAPGSGKRTGASGTAPGSGQSTGAAKTPGTTGSGKPIPGQARKSTDPATGTVPAATTGTAVPSSGSGSSNGNGAVKSRSARDAVTLSAVPAPPAN
jgi:hypothetical protein